MSFKYPVARPGVYVVINRKITVALLKKEKITLIQLRI